MFHFAHVHIILNKSLGFLLFEQTQLYLIQLFLHTKCWQNTSITATEPMFRSALRFHNQLFLISRDKLLSQVQYLYIQIYLYFLYKNLAHICV